MIAGVSDTSPPTATPAPWWLLAAVLAIATAWNIIGNLALPGAWYVPANLAVAAVLLALAWRAGLDADDLAVRPGDLGRGLLVGLGAAAVIAAVLALALVIPALDGALESDDVLADSTTDRWFVPLVRIPLGTAVFEEVLFRSVLLGALLTRWSTRTALAASSALFGLWHVVPAWETTSGSAAATTGAIVGTVVVTTVAGLLFGGLRLWSRSVVAPILAHIGTNSFAYVAALVALDLL